VKPESGQPARVGISLPHFPRHVPDPFPRTARSQRCAEKGSIRALRMRTPTCLDGWVALHDSVKSPCGRAGVGSHYTKYERNMECEMAEFARSG
jgi:hypothetical protein